MENGAVVKDQTIDLRRKKRTLVFVWPRFVQCSIKKSNLHENGTEILWLLFF